MVLVLPYVEGRSKASRLLLSWLLEKTFANSVPKNLPRFSKPFSQICYARLAPDYSGAKNG